MHSDDDTPEASRSQREKMAAVGRLLKLSRPDLPYILTAFFFLCVACAGLLRYSSNCCTYWSAKAVVCTFSVSNLLLCLIFLAEMSSCRTCLNRTCLLRTLHQVTSYTCIDCHTWAFCSWIRIELTFSFVRFTADTFTPLYTGNVIQGIAIDRNRHAFTMAIIYMTLFSLARYLTLLNAKSQILYFISSASCMICTKSK